MFSMLVSTTLFNSVFIASYCVGTLVTYPIWKVNNGAVGPKTATINFQILISIKLAFSWSILDQWNIFIGLVEMLYDVFNYVMISRF